MKRRKSTVESNDSEVSAILLTFKRRCRCLNTHLYANSPRSCSDVVDKAKLRHNVIYPHKINSTRSQTWSARVVYAAQPATTVPRKETKCINDKGTGGVAILGQSWSGGRKSNTWTHTPWGFKALHRSRTSCWVRLQRRTNSVPSWAGSPRRSPLPVISM